MKNIVNKVRIIVIVVIVYFVESRIFLFRFLVRSGVVICLVVRVLSFSSVQGIEESTGTRSRHWDFVLLEFSFFPSLFSSWH